MLILVDGPEKTGKTTLLTRVAEQCRSRHPVHFRFRYPIDLKLYLEAVKLAARPDTLVLLDRSWVSEGVYPALLGREPLAPDWWLEWCLGLPAATLGARLVAAPPERLAPLDGSDHQLDYTTERKAFVRHAVRYGYMVVDTTTVDPRDVIEEASLMYHLGPTAPTWSGSRAPKLLVVGERRNDASAETLAWAPATTRYWRMEVEHGLLRQVDQAGWSVGITNAADLSRVRDARGVVQAAETVLAYGREAADLVGRLGRTNHVALVHPAAKYRWGKYAKESSSE